MPKVANERLELPKVPRLFPEKLFLKTRITKKRTGWLLQPFSVFSDRRIDLAPSLESIRHGLILALVSLAKTLQLQREAAILLPNP